MANSVLENCRPNICDGWFCAFSNPQQFVTLLAAVAGIVLIGIVIVRLAKAPIADVGAGLAAVMAVGLVLLALPAITKFSLSFAPNQSVALEFKTAASAENVCTTANLVTEINKPLIERVSKLERDIQQLDRNGGGRTVALPSVVDRRSADIRIYYRTSRASDAEKLRLALVSLFAFVDAVMTDLSEVGAIEQAGFIRIRFEAVPPANWLNEANFLRTIVVRELGKVDRGPDAVPKVLPGNIQVLLY